jgi:hypothetical protein
MDLSHPMPHSLVLYRGKEGTLARAIVDSVLASTHLASLEVRDVDHTHPMLLIDDTFCVQGCLAVCRYFGRRWRLYPLHPEHALLVDGLLDRLAEHLALTPLDAPPPPATIAGYLADFFANTKSSTVGKMVPDVLESLFDDEETWLEGFARPTLADVCWKGAVGWMVDQNIVAIDASTHPRLARWARAA